MTLNEYIKSRGITQMIMAEEIPCSQSLISQICNGKHKPSYRMARRISNVTNGYVGVENWYPDTEIIGDGTGS